MTKTEMEALLAAGLSECDEQSRARIEALLVPLQEVTLYWEYGSEEEFPAWVFADLQERSVIAVFCLGGHGELGSPWGLNFRGDRNFGMDSAWFKSLRDLFSDWGITGADGT